MSIKIVVKNKRCFVEGAPVIVCGNSTYQIDFAFDAEWEQAKEKTARFSYVREGERRYQDVKLTGDTVTVPAVYCIKELKVGVYAGDLVTSTPARIPCEKSIVCDTCTPEELLPGQYEQLRDQLIDYIDEHISSGAGEDGASFSWKVVAETTLTENPKSVDFFSWKYTDGAITAEDIKKMSEFKLLLKLPFTEDVSANAFSILAMFTNAVTGTGYTLFTIGNIACTGGTPEAPKKIILTATITKQDTIFASVFRQATKSGDTNSPSATHRECATAGGNLFDADQWGFKLQLKTRPFPAGTQILLEGR